MNEKQRQVWEQLIAKAAARSPSLAETVREAMRSEMMMEEANDAIRRAEALLDLTRNVRVEAERAPDRSSWTYTPPPVEPSETASEILDKSLWSDAAELTCDVPGIRASTGDLLVFHFPWWGSLAPPQGIIRWLQFGDYELLRSLPRDAIRDFSPGSGWTPRRFVSDRRLWGKRLKVWHSRLALVKPLRLSDLEEIEAATDDGAIFELLFQVGCRMPRECA